MTEKTDAQETHDVLQFVDKNNTASLIAEAIAREYFMKTFSTMPVNLKIRSTGTLVGKLMGARKGLNRPGPTKNAKALAKPFVSRALESGHEGIKRANDFDYTPNLKNFMDYLIGDHRNRLLRGMLEQGKLMRFIDKKDISHPRQMSEKYLQVGPEKINLGDMWIYALNKESLDEVKNRYRNSIVDKTGKAPEHSKFAPTILIKYNTSIIPNISFIPEAKYAEVLEQIRKPAQQAVEAYIEGRIAD
jgi:hypothetical protein